LLSILLFSTPFILSRPFTSSSALRYCHFRFNDSEDLAKEMLEGRVSRVVMKSRIIGEWLSSFAALNIKIPLLRSITREPGPIADKCEEFALKEFKLQID